MFDKKTVLEVREDIPKKSTFLRDEFFNDERKYWTDTIIIESKKNGIPILPIVTENSQGTLMTNGVVKRDTLKIPRINPFHVINAEEIYEDREVGEDPNQEPDVEAKTDKKIAEKLVLQEEAISRSEELQAAQIMFLAILKLKGLDDFGNAKEYTVDYKMPNKFVLNKTDGWTNSGANPFKTLDMMLRTHALSQRPLDKIIMGKGAVDLLQWHNETLKMLDINGWKLFNFDPEKYNAVGARYIGTYKGYPIYEYQNQYEDNGVLKDMIPEFGVSMASKGNQRKYGRIINLKDPIPPTDRISYEVRETKAIKVETETKVMLVPNDVSAFVTADVEGV